MDGSFERALNGDGRLCQCNIGCKSMQKRLLRSVEVRQLAQSGAGCASPIDDATLHCSGKGYANNWG